MPTHKKYPDELKDERSPWCWRGDKNAVAATAA